MWRIDSGNITEMEDRPIELNIFAVLFNVEPADVPDNIQHKIIQL